VSGDATSPGDLDVARFALDATWERHGAVVLAGSPLRLFRLGAAGVCVAEHLENGRPINATTARSALVERLLDAGAIHPVLRPGRTRAAVGVTVVTPQLGGHVRHDGRLTVDDGSQPPLDGAAVRLERNAGPAAARNAARPLVDSPLVAFVDADVEADVPADGAWWTPLLDHFDDPRVALVAPRVTGEAGSPLDLGQQPARIRSGSRVSYVAGAAIVVRVEALDSIGWFDETLRFGEDVDLVWRLDEAGWWCRYDPSVHVWHEPRATIGARLRQHAGYGSSAAPLALRHPRALAPLRSNGWTAAVWAVAIGAGRPFVAGAIAVGSALALGPKLPDVPRSTSLALALRGHAMAGRQLTDAVRRVWWPVVAVAALRSTRARLLLAASVIASPRSAATDAAYGWGVWRGVRRHRTAAPLLPRISAWPARQPSTTATPAPRRRC